MIIIFDSGIGGFECAYRLCTGKEEEAKNTKQVLYFADKDNFPYGSKSKEELIQIITELFKFFESQKPELIIAACNTASTIIQELCQSDKNGFTKDKTYKSIQIVDMITSLNETMSKEANLTILATPITAQYLASSGHKVMALPKLAQMIELNEPIEEYLLENIPKDTKKILYACTHYPIVHETFVKLFNCEYFNPIDKIITKVKKKYTKYTLKFHDNQTSKKYSKITSKQAQFKKIRE